MTLPLTLSTGKPEHPAMDYAFLRRDGIRLLERLSGQAWTDFNAHDPGITILEQVCYAVTDLAYRIDYDIKDILASRGETDPYGSLPGAARVLTTNPVTTTDLRKLLLDVSGVKNSWLEPVESVKPGMVYDASENCIYLKTSAPQPAHRKPVALRGLCQVLLEIDGSRTSQEIKKEVNQRLHTCRSLCGDFLEPKILPPQGIVVKAEIEVGAIDNPEQLLAKIYYNLSRSISPRTRFYILSEMLAREKRIDEIMEGPALMHGFIDDAELESLQRKIGLRTSDLMKEILDVEGVLSVSSIKIADKDWYLKLDPQQAPCLDISHSAIRLMRSGIEMKVDPGRFLKILERLQQGDISQPLPESSRDICLPAGRDRQIGNYLSIQHQFPATYGIGAIGLPDSASPERKALAKQLKAYLMFFDQLLTNYFAQLENSKDLFSFYSHESGTYFSQVINDERLNIDEIYAKGLNADRLKEITATTAFGPETAASDTQAVKRADMERKNRFLNHLLARFAEQFPDYSLHGDERKIKDKSAFLLDYPSMGATRGSGFDYTQPPGMKNVSGLGKRISRKLGIPIYGEYDSKENDDNCFYMLEHILLRPGPADAGTDRRESAFLAEPAAGDPYSNQVSFVFSEKCPIEKKLIEKILREETPAHIRIHLQRLDKDKMSAFEAAYKTWLENMITGIDIKMRDARDRMVQILGIGTPYPLRDLGLDYPPMVPKNLATEIQIKNGQGDVRYLLCDEDGNPVEKGKEEYFEVTRPAETFKDQVSLPTPVILKDITFTVLAVREDKEKSIRLETYLDRSISIKVGIDTGLPIAFNKLEGQVVSENQITVNYGAIISVTVDRTQAGISYELVTDSKSLSRAEKGNQAGITLLSDQGFNEDTTIHVRAYRTDAPKVSDILKTELTILVRANPNIKIDVTPPIVDYSANTVLTLISPQAGVEYRLYKRELAPAEYLGSETGGFVVPNGEGRDIFIKTPGTVADWETPDSFTLVDPFKKNKGQLSAGTGSLPEDTLFIVQATKIENRERLQLTRAAAILVRPNTAPDVKTRTEVVESGQNGIVTLENTQKGVFYQLRLDADNTPVNPPGYHLTDRGVETARVEIDLVVEEQGEPILLLPTEAVTKKTLYNILAAKILTGVSAQLTGKATLDIQSPSTDNAEDKTEDEAGDKATKKTGRKKKDE